MSERERHYSRCGFGLLAVLALCATFAGVGYAQNEDYSTYPNQITVPANRWESVTPHDSTNLTYWPRAIYVGGAGNISAVDINNNAVTFTGVAAGSVLPIRPKRINSTGTTATGLVAIR